MAHDTDQEIVQSAEQIRLAEISLERLKREQAHEKWKWRSDVIQEIILPSSEARGWAHAWFGIFIFIEICWLLNT